MEFNNPFSQSIVSDAWQPAESDVREIHADVFDLCCASLDYVRKTGNSRSVLLHGLPGSGKTHLLARLRSHLTGELVAEDIPSAITLNGTSVLFTAVRLRAGPRMIARHLRRTLAGDLFRATGDGMLQLERVLLHRFSRHFKNPDKAIKWWRTLRQPEKERRWWHVFSRPDAVKLRAQVDDLIDRLDEEGALGRNLCAVLRHLSLGRHRRDARDWLRDGVLPESLMNELGFVPDPDDEDPEVQALEVVCALSRLADEKLPLVLCFDQVEALQTHPEDMEGLFAFGQMISSLRDKTRNTLFISCVQTAFLDVLNHVIRGADMDRLAEKEGLLKPLAQEEAEHLVTARLDAQPALRAARREQAYLKLWPLRTDRLKEFMAGSGACTPRQLISFCDDEFEAWRQGKAEAVLSTAEFLDTQFRIEQDRALAGSDSNLTDDILAHGLALAVEVLGQGQRAVEHALKDIDLVIDTAKGRRIVSFCNQSGGTLTRRLKRLREHVEVNELQGLVLIRDSRLPISKYAKKAREHFSALEELGVPVVRPTPDALAALEALRSLLSDAKAGDLANHGESVSTDVVAAWLAANLPAGLRQLLEETLNPSSGIRDAVYDDLLELLQQRRVLPVVQAAQQIGQELAVVERCVKRHLDQFGLLAGPPAVIFERVPETGAVG
jgi:hypothetical protein